MKKTLKQVVQELVPSGEKFASLKYHLKRSLQNTGEQKTVLEESEVIEVQDGFVTISFTWDMISAVNNLTNKYVDLTIPEKAFDVFD